MKRTWTIMIVPNSSGSVYNLTLKGWHLLVARSVLFCLVVAGLILAHQVIRIRMNEQSLMVKESNWSQSVKNLEVATETQRENTTLLYKKLMMQDDELESLRERVATVIKLENQIRQITGMQPTADSGLSETEDGVGGPSSGAGESLGAKVTISDSLIGVPENIHRFRLAQASADEALAAIATLAEDMEKERKEWEHRPTTWPVTESNARISCAYGWRIHPITGKKHFHSGTDIAGRMKTKVQATASGKVIYARWDGPYGRKIDIDHGNGYVTRYGHLSKIDIKKGDIVKKGDYIGLVGSTGHSTGPHVHYEVIYMKKHKNPWKFLIE
ncbi:M23 family metallopeptidase [Candidatus Hydrogenedentota bacterium]